MTIYSTEATLLEHGPLPGSEEWKTKYFTASRASIVMGFAPIDWGTTHSLFHEIRGTVPKGAEKSQMTRGHEFEPLIRQWFAEQYPHLTVEITGFWVNNSRPWQAGTPDGLILLSNGEVWGLEIKTDIELREWGEPGYAQKVPLKYLVQTQFQMDVTGWRKTLVVACGPYELFHRKPKVFEVDYVPHYAKKIRDRCRTFLDDVEMGFEPAPDYRAEKDREVLRYKHTDIADYTAEIDDETALAYLRSKAVEHDLGTEGKAAAAKIQAAIADKRIAVWRGIELAKRKKGTGGKPPSMAAVPGLAKRAAELIDTYEQGGLEVTENRSEAA